jgi:hypothetical protein
MFKSAKKILAISLISISILGISQSAFAAPVNQVLPAITGTTTLGSTLSVSSGTWQTSPSVVNYQWFRCTSGTDQTTCAAVSGANGSTYVIATADAGYYFLATVTAIDNTGSGTTVSSNFTGAVVVPPTNTAVPVISGTVGIGNVLTTTVGTWSGANNGNYVTQWMRCNSTYGCVAISGATGLSYTITNADIAYYFQVNETLYDATGSLSTTATSAATSYIYSQPISTSTSIITGSPTIGYGLVANPGVWASYPVATPTFQWQSCTAYDPTTCVNISGQTNNVYSLTTSDTGKYFRAIVTVLNSLGGAIQYTQIVGPASLAQAPISSSATTIDGTAKVGQTLTSYQGNWTGVPYPTFTRQWQRCSTSTNCTDISGATGNQYQLLATDEGFYFRAGIIGTNSAGSVTSYSLPSTIVLPLYANTAAPSLVGSAKVGSTLTATPGTWEGNSINTYNFQWQKCTSTTNDSCSNIVGATKNTYVVDSASSGDYLRVGVQLTGNLSFAYSGVSAKVGNTAIKKIVQPTKKIVASKKIVKTVVKKKVSCKKVAVKSKSGKTTYICKKLK